VTNVDFVVNWLSNIIDFYEVTSVALELYQSTNKKNRYETRAVFATNSKPSEDGYMVFTFTLEFLKYVSLEEIKEALENIKRKYPLVSVTEQNEIEKMLFREEKNNASQSIN
jgi:N-acetyl-gamma-glutamylphosphate reductase